MEIKKVYLYEKILFCRLRTREHIYVEPILLPCGNTACRRCAQAVTGWHEEYFECPFMDCGMKHVCEYRGPPNAYLIDLFNQNVKYIAKDILSRHSILTEGLLRQVHSDLKKQLGEKFEAVERDIDERVTAIFTRLLALSTSLAKQMSIRFTKAPENRTIAFYEAKIPKMIRRLRAIQSFQIETDKPNALDICDLRDNKSLKCDVFLFHGFESDKSNLNLMRLYWSLKQSGLVIFPGQLLIELEKLIMQIVENRRFLAEKSTTVNPNFTSTLKQTIQKLNFVDSASVIDALQFAEDSDLNRVKVQISMYEDLGSDDLSRSRLFKDSKIVVFCISHSYYNSPLFKKHLKAAEKLKKTVLPVLLYNPEETDKKLELDFGSGVKTAETCVYFHYETSEADLMNGVFYQTLHRIFTVIQRETDIVLDIAVIEATIHGRSQKCKQICICQSLEYEDEVSELASILKKAGYEVWLKTAVNSQLGESYQAVQEYLVVLFCLTKKYMKSREYEIEMKYARAAKRTVIHVLMEEIDEPELKGFKSIVYDGSRFTLMKLRSFLSTVFAVEKPSRAMPFRIDTKKPDTIRLNAITGINYLPCRGQLIFNNQNVIFLVNASTYKVIEQVDLKKIRENSDLRQTFGEQLTSICVVQKNKVCILDNNVNKHLYLVDRNFTVIHQIQLELQKNDKNREYCKVEYNSRSNLIYVFDDETVSVVVFNEQLELVVDTKIGFDSLSLQTMKSVSDSNCMIYTASFNSKCIMVFDEHFNYMNSFAYNILQKPVDLLVDPCNSEFLLVLEATCLRVFNLLNYKHVGKFELENDGANAYKGLIVNEKLLVTASKCVYVYPVRYSLYDNKKIYSTKYGTSYGPTLGQYLCKFNAQADLHLYREPYQMPCGETACLDCIFISYNLRTDTFRCIHDDCKSVKGLVLQENQRLKLSFEHNLSNLAQEMVRCGRLYEKFDFKQRFEALFDHIEYCIDLRRDSVMVKLDQEKENILSNCSLLKGKSVLGLPFKVSKTVVNHIFGKLVYLKK